MEKHRCGICFRRFSSGRALGGHMRSHVTAATPPPKLHARHCSAASSSSAGHAAAAGRAEEEEELTKGTACCLRENSRKSFRLVDPEFSAAAFAAVGPAVSSSVVVQDFESGSESEFPCAAAAAHRRRSKGARRPRSPTTPEPGSSASNVTTEEDVALCLMMLSRDCWTGGKGSSAASDADEEEENGRRIAAQSRPPGRGRSKYQCGKCRKVFRSNQALDGHRASHHKPNGCLPALGSQRPGGDDEFEADAKVHECPFCFRVFASGQALGGHKRSHLTSSTITTTSPASVRLPSCSPPSTSTASASASASASAAPLKYCDSLGLIDLNLPATVDEEMALSAVSDHTVS